MKPSVLFVCVHNAGRSQMAAGLLRDLAGDAIEVRSAGTQPREQINPVAAQAMAEIGIDITARPADTALPMPVPGLGATSRDFLRLLLLTGQSRDEVRLMSWAEVDMEAALWVIPASRYKTGIEHAVPLSSAVMDILRARWHDGATGYVLPGRREDQPFNGALSAIRRLRKAMANRQPFTLHDFRRTVRTGLSRLKVDPVTSELVIGHVPQGMHKVYDVYERLEERRKALEKWINFVLMRSPASSE